MTDPTKLTAAMTISGGRWRVTPDLYHECFAVVDEAGLLMADGLSRDEAHAIVRVHNAVPDLLDEIKRLAAQVERVRAVAERYDADARHEGYGGEMWSTTAAEINAALDGRL